MGTETNSAAAVVGTAGRDDWLSGRRLVAVLVVPPVWTPEEPTDTPIPDNR